MGEQEHPVDRVVAALRENPLDFTGELATLRERFEQLGLQGVPPGAAQRFAGRVGGVPVIDLDDGAGGREGVVVFLHAGGYVAGTAAGSIAFARRVAEHAHRRVVSVDYRLAPEHPFPAARDDLVAVHRALLSEVSSDQIAFVGASAGGGIVLQALQALRDAGDPLPAAAALFSPFADLTLSGASYDRNAERDPSLTRAGLLAAVAAYAAPDPAALVPSAETLRGLPPLQVHVGSIEILLSDALAIAAGAAQADVRLDLEVWPGMVHVFPTFAARLPEGVAALRSAGAFLDRWMDS